MGSPLNAQPTETPSRGPLGNPDGYQHRCDRARRRRWPPLAAGHAGRRGRAARPHPAGPVRRSTGDAGPLTESLALALGPGGVSAAVAACVVTWLRQRSSDVVVRVRGDHGRSVEVSAKRVRGLDSSQLHDLTRRLAGELTELGAGPTGGAAGEDPAGGGGPAAT